MNGYLLDTHVWLWIAQNAVEEVSADFFSEAEDWRVRGQLYLSPFSCWELGLLVSAGHLSLDQPIESLWARATDLDTCRIGDLTASVLIESTRLPGDLHRDPADRILVATARVYELTLVTRDKLLLNYARQGHVRARKP